MRLRRFGLLGFVALAAAALFNLGAIYSAERSFAELSAATAWLRHTQLAQNLIEQLYKLMIDAETGQRGFLLTGDPAYLTLYDRGTVQAAMKVGQLRDLTRESAVHAAQIVNVEALVKTRLAQMDDMLARKRNDGDEAVRSALRSRQGATTMDALRLALDSMAAEERLQYERRFETFAAHQDRLRTGFFVVAALNLLLVTLGAIFLRQDARRRRLRAAAMEDRNAQLAQAVQEGTAELTELSHYLQRLQEDEKAKIAREIHDELGGTLAAAKIDLQLLSDKLPEDSPHQSRIARIDAAIDDAVQVKRRITEDLRPAILDNLGIGPAIRWHCSEWSRRSGLRCRVELASENLQLSAPYSIAFYRAVQEALTNIGKHANAKNAIVSLQRDAKDWILRIVDDGVGIDTSQPGKPLAHGLLSMRERVRALGGQLSIRGREGRGTVIEIRVGVDEAVTA